jgi:hypothetical protein
MRRFMVVSLFERSRDAGGFVYSVKRDGKASATKFRFETSLRILSRKINGIVSCLRSCGWQIAASLLAP